VGALLDELPEDLAEKTIQNKKAALGDAAELSTRIIKRLSKRTQRKTRGSALSTLPLRITTLLSFRCFMKISIGKLFP
jgi:hypothetical protein